MMRISRPAGAGVGTAHLLSWAFAERRVALAGAWLLGLAGVALSLVMPDQVGRLTRLFSGDGTVTWSPVLLAILLLVGAQLGVSAVTYLRARLEASLRESAVRRLVTRVYARILRLDPEFFRREPVERINARAMEDTNRVGLCWADALVGVPLAVVGVVVVGIVMVRVDALLGACLVVLSTLSGYFALFDRRMQETSRTIRDTWETIRTSANETVAGVAEIRGHAAFEHVLGGLGRSFAGYEAAMGRFGRFTATFRAMDPLVATVQRGALFAVGAALCMDGPGGPPSAVRLTWPDVIQFMLLAQVFQSSVAQLASHLLQLRVTRESGRRMGELLARPAAFDETAGGTTLPPGPPAVRFDHVGVTTETGRSLLEDVSLDVGAGQRVTLCGPSGCGKSTLVHVLARGVRPSRGRCLLGEGSVERHDVLSFARTVGLVPQTPVLFDTSIRQNLLLGLRRPSGRCIQDAHGPLDVERLEDVRGPEDLDRVLVALVREVGLEPDVVDKGLDGPLPPVPAAEAIRSRIPSLRERLSRALQDEPPGAVLPLDAPEPGPAWVDAWTLRENVLRGRPDASRHGVPERIGRRVVEAIREEGLLDAVVLAGLEFRVGEGGRYLSGGQRQKVALARALLKNPTLLLLDEATSALDDASEARVLAAVERRRPRQTTISITHRLANARDSDRIVVMDRGQVVQVGDYEGLVAEDGVFRTLVGRERGEPAADARPAVAVAGPEASRRELERRIALSGTFGGLRADQVERLAREMRVLRTAGPEVLFRRGDEGRDLYVILDGRVEFFVERAPAGPGSATVVNALGPGGVFGELALFGAGRRTVGARTVGETTLGVLGRDALVRTIHEDPRIALALLGSVSTYLARTADAAYDGAPRPTEVA